MRYGFDWLIRRFGVVVMLASTAMVPAASAQPAMPSAGALDGGATPTGPAAIPSTASANTILEEAAAERVATEKRYADAERACQLKFLVNRCMDEAKERRRLTLATLRAREVEANLFKRRERVAERDRALEDARVKDAGAPPRPISARSEKITEQVDEKTSPATLPSLSKNRPKPAEPQPRKKSGSDAGGLRIVDGAAEVAKRADKTAVFETKARKSAERLRELEARRTEKAAGNKAKLDKDAASNR